MNRKEELKKAYLAGFIEGGISKILKGIKHHIEDMADEYAQYQINLSLGSVSGSLPSFDDIDEMAKEKCGVENIHERRAFCDGAEWMKSHIEGNNS